MARGEGDYEHRIVVIERKKIELDDPSLLRKERRLTFEFSLLLLRNPWSFVVRLDFFRITRTKGRFFPCFSKKRGEREGDKSPSTRFTEAKIAGRWWGDYVYSVENFGTC